MIGSDPSARGLWNERRDRKSLRRYAGLAGRKSIAVICAVTVPWGWATDSARLAFSCHRPCAACASAARSHAKRSPSTAGPFGVWRSVSASRWRPRAIELALPLRPVPVRPLLPCRPSRDSNVCICAPSRNDRARCVRVARRCEQPLKECTAPGRSTDGASRRSSSARVLSKSAFCWDALRARRESIRRWSQAMDCHNDAEAALCGRISVR